MSFLIRLLLVPLAGMFILVARRAEQSSHQPALRPLLTPASQCCAAPAPTQALAPVFVTAGFRSFPQQVAGAELPTPCPLPTPCW